MFFALCVSIRIAESFGTCCHSTASYTYVMKLFPDSIGLVFGLTETAVGLGLILGPAIGSFLFHFGNYTLPFYFFSIVMLLCFPFNLYFLENINKMDVPADSNETSSNSSDNDRKKKATYWSIIKIPKIFVICLVIVVMSLAQSYLEPTFEPHMRTAFGYSQETVGIFFLVGSMSYAISTPVVGYFATKTANKFIVMMVGTVITLVGLLMIGPSPIIYFAPKSVYISIIGLILISFGHGVAFIPTFESLFDYCILSDFRNDMKTYSKVSGLWGSLFSFGEFVG